MPSYVKCKRSRMAVTETACRNMRSKQAFICIGCTGPALISGGGQLMIRAEVEPGSAPQLAHTYKPVRATIPGLWVDFSGCEDLLERFKAAAAERGMKPGASALDLIYLFDAGMLVLRRKP